jgi:serine/threonine protein kinase
MAQAGLEGGVTLEQINASADQKPVRDLLAGRGKKRDRYILEKEIARGGGMGAVLRAVDCDIRREVAVKYMLDPANPEKKLRFVEEAQITGQLEHPNIVPIHELGVDAQRRMFFTMKMVRGRSLAQIIQGLRDDPQAQEKKFPLGRLLTIFVGMCHALAYAHSRRVVHRDLKPANIMIGDFGAVYVMDWGLAKVVTEPTMRGPLIAHVGAFRPELPGAADPHALAGKIATSRDAGDDLTRDGAVIGTPAYMPPEQAAGDVQAIDQRSDVYALGAILYEMLTLQAPISREGGHLAVLQRVAQGAIVPPQERDPQRARAGKVPAELSAIAMKALAKNPDRRYPDVETLRRDIELFQEGRSVSAKQDNFRELAWKLVKRNKGVSITAAAALIIVTSVLAVSFWTVLDAKADAESALHTLKQEQLVKRQRGKASAPLFVRDAKQSAEKKQLDYALEQLNVALDSDPDNVEGRLVKGQILIVQKDYAEARKELKAYLKQRPNDKNAAELLLLCGATNREDIERTHAIAEVFARQKAFGLALQMETDRDLILLRYRQRVEAAWPGLGNRVSMIDGKCELDLTGCKQVKDLTPLEGMTFNILSLANCTEVRDLTPLKGMPLTDLDLQGCRFIKELTALQGMDLTRLNLSSCDQLEDLTPLQGMKLTRLKLYNCKKLHDLAPLQGMPLTELSLDTVPLLRNLAPLRGMPLTSLNLENTECDDLSPLKDLPLVTLDLFGARRIKDLTPLCKMSLTTLELRNCPAIEDLEPIRELQLTEFGFPSSPQCKDLGVLRKMPLARLNLTAAYQIRDLTPLEGRPLKELLMPGCDQVKDLSGLRGVKLNKLVMSDCTSVHDLAPLQWMPLDYLNMRNCGLVRDLAPLKGISRKTMNGPPSACTSSLRASSGIGPAWSGAACFFPGCKAAALASPMMPYRTPHSISTGRPAGKNATSSFFILSNG